MQLERLWRFISLSIKQLFVLPTAAPLIDFQHLVSGNYTSQHAYKVGDKLTIDCQVLSMPKSVITIQKDGKVLQSTPHLKVSQHVT